MTDDIQHDSIDTHCTWNINFIYNCTIYAQHSIHSQPDMLFQMVTYT